MTKGWSSNGKSVFSIEMSTVVEMDEKILKDAVMFIDELRKNFMDDIKLDVQNRITLETGDSVEIKNIAVEILSVKIVKS